MTVDREPYHARFGGQAQVGDIAPIVLLVTDPLAVDRLAKRLENPTLVADHYEFIAVTGTWRDVQMSLCSTGIGGGSASIAVDELARLGGRTFVYAGVRAGDDDGLADQRVQVATGAIRLDGTSRDYVDSAYPAVAHVEPIMALLHAAKDEGFSTELGLFLAHAGPPGENGLRQLAVKPSSVQLIPANPEIATILTQCGLYRFRAGAVQLQVSDRQRVSAAQDQVSRLALHAAWILAGWDAMKASLGWKIMTPSIRAREEAS